MSFYRGDQASALLLGLGWVVTEELSTLHERGHIPNFFDAFNILALFSLNFFLQLAFLPGKC